MNFLRSWRWCVWLPALPLCACVSLPTTTPVAQAQACTNCQESGYAVANPHPSNDYPVSYRVNGGSEADGRTNPVDRQIYLSPVRKPLAFQSGWGVVRGAE